MLANVYPPGGTGRLTTEAAATCVCVGGGGGFMVSLVRLVALYLNGDAHYHSVA